MKIGETGVEMNKQMENIISKDLWYEVASEMCNVLLGMFGVDWLVSWIADCFTEEEQEIIYKKFGF